MIFLKLFSFWISLLVFSDPSQAQLSKSSPFLSKKNFLTESQRADSPEGLALVSQSCMKASGALLKTQIPSDLIALPFEAGKMSEKEFQLFVQNPCVFGVGKNEVAKSTSFTPNDPLFKDQLFYQYNRFLRIFAAFKSPSVKSLSPVTVAIVDSGISTTHPEFIGRFWQGAHGQYGYNFIDDNFDIEDKAGHGTHVAGLVAAQADNHFGVVGVAQNVRLMILKTQGVDGNGTLGNVVNAIRYAADHGAEVINLSLAIGQDTPFMRDAIDYALERGAVVIAASGNNGIQVTSSQFISPAGFSVEKPGLISVGSVDSLTGELSFFSNYSNSLIEIAAPGSHDLHHILSTYKEEKFFSTSGTSMATPQVAGAAALIIGHLKAQNISYRPSDIEELLLQGSRVNGKLENFIIHGRELDFEGLKNHLFKLHHLSSDGGLND